jgi:23S rRNA (guanosine2251-2'-O)-methyltransferase
MRELLYGRNPVLETLRARRRHVHGLMLAEGVKESPEIQTLFDLCKEINVPVRRVPREEIEKVSSSAQGVALEVGAYPYAEFDQVLAHAQRSGRPPFLLLLDSIQDPQNLGTLVRTAEAVGVHGVCIPPHNAARVTPAVVSASSGACEHLPIAQLNLVNAIRDLKEAGVWVIGLDAAEDAQPPERVDLSGPVAIVVGSEGQGMRRLVRESCDLLLRLPMVGKVESLNAAIAGSVVLYMAFRARFTLNH